jgi:hypothetical protein
MTLIEYENTVQALGRDRSDPALGDGVGSRRSEWRANQAICIGPQLRNPHNTAVVGYGGSLSPGRSDPFEKRRAGARLFSKVFPRLTSAVHRRLYGAGKFTACFYGLVLGGPPVNIHSGFIPPWLFSNMLLDCVGNGLKLVSRHHAGGYACSLAGRPA